MDKSLYEVLASLCKSKGITAYRMCKDLELQPSLMTDLKAGRRKGVSADTASKIANYFNVSLDYLLSKEKAKEDDRLAEYLEELRNREEMRMLFDLAKGASKEDVEKAVRIIEALSKK